MFLTLAHQVKPFLAGAFLTSGVLGGISPLTLGGFSTVAHLLSLPTYAAGQLLMLLDLGGPVLAGIATAVIFHGRVKASAP